MTYISPHSETNISDRLAESLMFLLIISATFLQKLAVPVGSGTQIFFSFFVMSVIVIIGVLSSRLVIQPKQLFLYLVMVSILTFTQLAGHFEFSVLSLLLLFMTTMLYSFRLRSGARSMRPNYEIYLFQNVVMLLAVLGIFQFLIQFVVGVQYAFPLEQDNLKSVIMQSYNSLNPIRYGSAIIKPNAVFLLEPSTLSKLIAISIIVEITTFRRLKRIAFLFLAQAFTFSGTGLILLFLLLPFYLLQKRQFHILIGMFVALLSAPYWAPAVGLERTLERTSEFTQPGTSGYARFVSVFPIIRDHIAIDTQTLLLGHGAGYVSSFDSMYDYEVHPPSWGKLWIEYGLVGLLAYLAFILPAIWSGPRSAYLKMALTIFIFYDNIILIPEAHCLILALLVWPSANVPPKEAEKVLEVKAS